MNAIDAESLVRDSDGNLTSTGKCDTKRSWRFSTNPFHAETRLIYYAFRYYHGHSGRWLNRDPIGENGGIDLYAFVVNAPVNWFDVKGRAPMGWPVLPPPGYPASFPGPPPGFDIRPDLERLLNQLMSGNDLDQLLIHNLIWAEEDPLEIDPKKYHLAVGGIHSWKDSSPEIQQAISDICSGKTKTVVIEDVPLSRLRSGAALLNRINGDLSGEFVCWPNGGGMSFSGSLTLRDELIDFNVLDGVIELESLVRDPLTLGGKILSWAGLLHPFTVTWAEPITIITSVSCD